MSYEDDGSPDEERADPLSDDDRLLNLTGPREFETSFGHLAPDLRYTEGFRRAADVLSNYVFTSTVDLDDVAMPILYCYRQSIELRLKYLLALGGMLERKDVLPVSSHDLMYLWRKVRPVLEQNWGTGGPTILDRVARVLDEFAKLDSGGYGFRYPVDLKGAPSLSPELTINLHNVRTVASRAEQHLDDAAEHIMGTLLDRAFNRPAT